MKKLVGKEKNKKIFFIIENNLLYEKKTFLKIVIKKKNSRVMIKIMTIIKAMLTSKSIVTIK